MTCDLQFLLVRLILLTEWCHCVMMSSLLWNFSSVSLLACTALELNRVFRASFICLMSPVFVERKLGTRNLVFLIARIVHLLSFAPGWATIYCWMISNIIALLYSTQSAEFADLSLSVIVISLWNYRSVSNSSTIRCTSNKLFNTLCI